MWCRRDEVVKETQLVQRVLAESLQHRSFLEAGEPLCFEVPPVPGPVVSAVRLGDQLLVRRTDFAPEAGPAALKIDGVSFEIPSAPGRCQVLPLPRADLNRESR
jgi:hypothetical protein